MFGCGTGFRAVLILPVALVSLGSLVVEAGEPEKPASLVRIGMIGTLFKDVPESTVLAMMQPFSALMQAQTGVSGQLVPVSDVDALGQQLVDDKLQLGVFHGIEFAWARQKHPELRPLMIAVNQQRYLRAHLVVRSDNAANCVTDLQDRVLALPRETKDHCQLFLQRRCQESNKGMEVFFAKITTPANAEDALDDVIDGTVQAALVDAVALDSYKRRKPGRFTKLKTAQTSEVFPAAVVAYRPGILEEATLKRFRDGLTNANQTILGKQMLTLWKLTGFETIPTDYEQTLTDIARVYPPPQATAPK